MRGGEPDQLLQVHHRRSPIPHVRGGEPEYGYMDDEYEYTIPHMRGGEPGSMVRWLNRVAELTEPLD